MNCAMFNCLPWTCDSRRYVEPECRGKTVEMNEAGWKAFVSETVDVAIFGLRVLLYSFTQYTPSSNIVKGINALRCSLVSGFDNMWYIAAHHWYFGKQLDDWGIGWNVIKMYYNGTDRPHIIDMIGETTMEAWLTVKYAQAYPHICSCTVEINGWAKDWGARVDDLDIFSTCADTAYTAVNVTLSDDQLNF